MELKSSKLVLGIFDGKDILLDLLLTIEEEELRWSYLIYIDNKEIIRDSVHGTELKDLPYVFYNDLYSKGIDLTRIKDNSFLKEELGPYVDILECVIYCVDNHRQYEPLLSQKLFY